MKIIVRNISYYKDLNISDKKIEELRIILVKEYKKNRPISIINFIKLIEKNPVLPTWLEIQEYFKTSSFQEIFMYGAFGINIKRARQYNNRVIENKKAVILKRIVEIYASNNNVITERILKQNNLYPTRIKLYFTSMGEAYRLAGVKPSYTKPHHITKEEFIIRFTKLMPEFSKNNISFTVEELRKQGLTFHYIKMYYGNLCNLLNEFNISI